jgi:hypothetical protein
MGSVVALLFLLVIVAIIGFRLTTGEDRKLLLKALAALREMGLIAQEEYARLEPFRAALRKRTRYAIVAPALAALSVMLFARMLFGSGALTDPSTLISWGANFGPRTTNGEWWRLLTSTFVHTGFLRMAVEAAVLAQLGILMERLAGRSTLASVSAGAGPRQPRQPVRMPRWGHDRHVRRDLRPLWSAAGLHRPQPACTPDGDRAAGAPRRVRRITTRMRGRRRTS